MVQYELMVIGSDKQDAEAVFEKVKKFLEASEASNVSGQNLGKKQLAYPIRRLTEADYFLYAFEADAEILKRLEEKLRLEQEAIMRYLITKFVPKKISKVKVVESQKVKESETVEKPKPRVTVTTKVSVKESKSKVKVKSRPKAQKI